MLVPKPNRKFSFLSTLRYVSFLSWLFWLLFCCRHHRHHSKNARPVTHNCASTDITLPSAGWLRLFSFFLVCFPRSLYVFISRLNTLHNRIVFDFFRFFVSFFFLFFVFVHFDDWEWLLKIDGAQYQAARINWYCHHDWTLFSLMFAWVVCDGVCVT